MWTLVSKPFISFEQIDYICISVSALNCVFISLWVFAYSKSSRKSGITYKVYKVPERDGFIRPSLYGSELQN